MTIVAAIGKACGIHRSCAARPTGLIVTVTRQGGLRVRSGVRERAFQPNLQDIVADDWDVGDLDATIDSFAAPQAAPETVTS